MLTLPFAGRPVLLKFPNNTAAQIGHISPIGPIPDSHDPHWSALWPSSIALADALLSGEIAVAVARVLELGCGLGLGSIAAALAGAAMVLATDIEPRALDCTRANAELNGAGDAIATRILDWRAPESGGPGLPRNTI